MCGVSLLKRIPEHVTEELCDCVHLYRGWVIVYFYFNVVPFVWIFWISYRIRKRFSSRREAKFNKRLMIVTVTPGLFIQMLIGITIFIRS